jgi:chromosome segregation ATPase
MFSEPKTRLGRSTISQSSPRLRRDDYDDGSYAPSGSKYETIGIKEELKQKEAEVSYLRRDMEMLREQQVSRTRRLEEELNEAFSSRKALEDRLGGELFSLEQRKDEEIFSLEQRKDEEIEKLKHSYEEEMARMRVKLVNTFKEDMEEMKSEWEGAFRRLQEESDATKRALNNELSDAIAAKAEMESKFGKLHADFRSQLDDEKHRAVQQMEDLKKSNEEELSRLREMYEDHIDGIKQKAASVEANLKDELQMILEENEKVKMCYDNLEEEMTRAKHELNEINEQYQDALDENDHFKKDAKRYKEEADKMMNENDKLRRDLLTAKNDIDRITSSYERVGAERNKIEKEYEKLVKEKAEHEKKYEKLAKEKAELGSSYEDIAKKLEGLEEERVLESRYTEALVKQRDNMNEIIENGQEEIKELRAINNEIRASLEPYQRVAEQFNLPNAEAFRDEFAKSAKMRERLESLGRERERYNSTIKALKVDIKSLHKGDLGPESSLQDHMRLLSEEWEKYRAAAKETKNLKAELEESIQLLEENNNKRNQMLAGHNSAMSALEKELQDVKKALEDTKRSGAQQQEAIKELEKRSGAQQQEALKELETLRANKSELEASISKTEAIKEGLKKNLEKAYFDLEEAQLEITAIKRNQEKEFDSIRSQLTKQHDRIIESQEEEILSLQEKLQQAKRDRAMDLEIAKNEIAESFKAQLRLAESKHKETELRAKEHLEQKYMDEMNGLCLRNKELERSLKEQKEALEQKSMAEIKRRGEFAKQKQEVEILRSKERHLEAHVAQLEQMQAKTVAEYEQRIASSNSVCTNSSVEKSLKKQVKELERKLEVSSAAMKQLGKSSLLMEKENQRLQKDKNDLKLQLQKLVDCAEKLEGKK